MSLPSTSANANDISTGSIIRQMIITNLSGGVAGAAGVAIGVPFDIVKIRMQTFPTLYKSAIPALFSIIKTEGFTRGLFKGSLVPILCIVPANALAFSGEDFFRSFLKRHIYKSDKELGSIDSLLAGMIGGVMQCSVFIPCEVIKCNMQIDNIRTASEKPKYHSNWQCFKHILKTEGISGIYKGGAVTVIREAPGFGVYFATYRCFTTSFQVHRNETAQTTKTGVTPPWAILVGGGLAGCASWLSIYPFDVIKSNIQIEQGGKGANNKELLSTFGMGKHLLKKHGAGIFIRGLGPTLARAFPVNAVTFYLNENFKGILNKL